MNSILLALGFSGYVLGQEYSKYCRGMHYEANNAAIMNCVNSDMNLVELKSLYFNTELEEECYE